MGNCPTTPNGLVSKSLDPLCHGERMWTTFLCSSLFTLFGGWIIILIYDFVKAIVIKRRRLQLLTNIKRFSRINDVRFSLKLKVNCFFEREYIYISLVYW